MTASSAGQSGFLRLPQEIRDEIYTLSMQKSWGLHKNQMGVFRYSTCNEEPKRWRQVNLLLVCRAVRAEVQALMRRRVKVGKVSAELAIVIRGFNMDCTWTYLDFSLLPRSPLNVQVNLQVFSTESFLQGSPTWHKGREYTRLIARLGQELNRFLLLGPSYREMTPDRITYGPMFIRQLRVNMSFSDWYTPATHSAAVHQVFRTLKALSQIHNSHQYIGKIIASADYEVDGQMTQRQSAWQTRLPATADDCQNPWLSGSFRLGQAWVATVREMRQAFDKGIAMENELQLEYDYDFYFGSIEKFVKEQERVRELEESASRDA